MTAEMLCCPYCNTYIPLKNAVRSGNRVRCPRCQELFPFRAGDQSTESDNGPLPATELGELQEKEPRGLVASPPQRTNLPVAAGILILMGAMALIAFAYAKYTRDWRRSLDHRSPQREAPPAQAIPVLVPPAKLTGLGFAPADSDVLLGVHVAGFLSDVQGDNLLSVLLGAVNFQGSALEQWIGLKLDDVDHIVVALKTQDRILPRTLLIVETGQPYDRDKLGKTLHIGRRVERAGRTIYRFTPGQTALETAVWFAGDRTLIFGMIPEDFDRVPITPEPAAERLDPQLIGLIEPLKAGPQMWLAGLSKDWDRFLNPNFEAANFQLPLAGLRAETRDVLGEVRQFVAWLSIDKEVDLRFKIGLSDPDSATKLNEIFNKSVLPKIDQKKPEGLQLQLTTDEDWLTGKAKIGLDALEELIRQ
jgi:hypothetical protein